MREELSSQALRGALDDALTMRARLMQNRA
jgi:hypothetical protein